MIFEDMFKFNNMLMTKRLMNLYFCNELYSLNFTFCLALDLLSEFLAMILAADILLVYRLVTS